MKLKIAIDCRHVQYYKEGITRSTLNLISLLRDEFEFHALLSDKRISVPELERYSNVTRHYLGPASSKLDWLWENYSLVKLLNVLKPDIYHAPCTMGLPLKKIPGIKYVVTIHDLILKYFPSSYPFFGRLKWHIGIRIDFWRADRIITVSQYTKDMLCKQYNVSAENIHVVPHAIAPVFSDRRKEKDAIEQIKMRFGISSDYIMYHGGFRPYKNVSEVIESYNAYRGSGGRLKLCIAGKHNAMFKQFIQPIIDKSPFKSEIHSIGYVPDDELSYLLSGSKCFLYLSKMEGFGYAPLEAMACGVPVLCSKNTSMIENLSDCACWVEDSESPKEIARKISMLVSDPSFGSVLIEKGLKNASRFSKGQNKMDSINAYSSNAVN